MPWADAALLLTAAWEGWEVHLRAVSGRRARNRREAFGTQAELSILCVTAPRPHPTPPPHTHITSPLLVVAEVVEEAVLLGP